MESEHHAIPLPSPDEAVAHLRLSPVTWLLVISAALPVAFVLSFSARLLLR